MMRATLLFLSLFIATLASILLVLSALGTGTMSFPSADRLSSGFAGFRSGNVYIAWQSFLDGPVDDKHTVDATSWGSVGVKVQNGGMTSSGKNYTDLESRFAGIGWTTEPIVARLGMYDPPPRGSTQPTTTQGALFSGTYRAKYFGLKVPLAWIMVLACIYPGMLLRRRFMTTRRLARGECVQCGYDLRESPDRCPECGLAVR